MSRTLILALILIQATLLFGHRIRKPITPYYETVAKSDLVVVGQIVQQGGLRDITDLRPAPTREPIAEKHHGHTHRELPRTFSWNREQLHNPEELHVFQAQLQILYDPTGAMPEGRTVLVNLGYAINPTQLETYLGTHYAKKYCEPDSFAIFHLKQVQYDDERVEYELVLMPWVMERADVDLKKGELDIRWARYKAYVRIEALMTTWRDNKRAEFDEIFNLLYSEPEEMGEPVWLPGELEGIQRLDQRTKSGAANEPEWRQWWNIHKVWFVDAPFRRISNK